MEEEEETTTWPIKWAQTCRRNKQWNLLHSYQLYFSAHKQCSLIYFTLSYLKTVLPACWVAVIEADNIFEFSISNFRLVLNVVCFLLGNSPASEFYMSTFRNTLSVPSSWAGRCKMTKFDNFRGTHKGEGLARK